MKVTVRRSRMFWLRMRRGTSGKGGKPGAWLSAPRGPEVVAPWGVVAGYGQEHRRLRPRRVLEQRRAGARPALGERRPAAAQPVRGLHAAVRAIVAGVGAGAGGGWWGQAA